MVDYAAASAIVGVLSMISRTTSSTSMPFRFALEVEQHAMPQRRYRHLLHVGKARVVAPVEHGRQLGRQGQRLRRPGRRPPPHVLVGRLHREPPARMRGHAHPNGVVLHVRSHQNPPHQFLRAANLLPGHHRLNVGRVARRGAIENRLQ
jgi:hypothetical protein